jgi:hypothetical protein
LLPDPSYQRLRYCLVEDTHFASTGVTFNRFSLQLYRAMLPMCLGRAWPKPELRDESNGLCGLLFVGLNYYLLWCLGHKESF